jgi:uncharacterized damage-inducible protein DinB
MWVDPDDDPREHNPDFGRDELGILRTHLLWNRQTLELKCSGLTPEQLAMRSVEPSNLSLLGLIRHMANVERGWFRRKLAGQAVPSLYVSKDNPDGDFDDAVGASGVVAEAFATWRAEMAFTDDFIVNAPNLEVTGHDPHMGDVTLREILVHMIEEYGRHLGHADFLRERIDGRTGQ